MIVLRKIHAIHEITAVQDLEEQFVTLFAILAHQCAEVLQRGGLDRFERKSLEHRTDGVENIVAARHLNGQEVARSLRYRAFNSSHNFTFLKLQRYE